MKTQSKLTFTLAVSTLLGWGLFFLQKSQPPKTVSIPVERIVAQTKFVDRIVERVVERKVTRPDGTIIETKIVSNEKSKATTTASDVTVVKPPLPTLSLGLSLVRPPTLDFSKPTTYRPDIGFRTWENVWTTTSIDLNPKLKIEAVSLGVRVVF